MSDKNLVTEKVHQRLIALGETQRDPTSLQASPASAVTQLLAGAHRPMEDVTMATVLQMVGTRDLKPHFEAARHGFVEQGDSDEEPEPRLAEGWYRAGRAATTGERRQQMRERGSGSGAWASCDQHMVLRGGGGADPSLDLEERLGLGTEENEKKFEAEEEKIEDGVDTVVVDEEAEKLRDMTTMDLYHREEDPPNSCSMSTWQLWKSSAAE